MSTKRCPRCKGTGLADLDSPDLDCDYCDGDGVIDTIQTWVTTAT
jgi:DnaJ-class molecular chaperone